MTTLHSLFTPPARPTLLIATNNAHKVREIGQILESLGGAADFTLLSGADFPDLAAPEETGATFEENALIKARAYAAATGLLTLADDSGLAVDALGGAPGVYSARYAPTSDAANERLLAELRGVEPARRGAHYACVMALADGRGGAAVRHGMLAGRIAQAPRGSGGFGYDPVFELTEAPHAGKTAAEIGAAEKNAISHRGRALAAIAPLILRSLAAGRVE